MSRIVPGLWDSELVYVENRDSAGHSLYLLSVGMRLRVSVYIRCLETSKSLPKCLASKDGVGIEVMDNYNEGQTSRTVTQWRPSESMQRL